RGTVDGHWPFHHACPPLLGRCGTVPGRFQRRARFIEAFDGFPVGMGSETAVAETKATLSSACSAPSPEMKQAVSPPGASRPRLCPVPAAGGRMPAFRSASPRVTCRSEAGGRTSMRVRRSSVRLSLLLALAFATLVAADLAALRPVRAAAKVKLTMFIWAGA